MTSQSFNRWVTLGANVGVIAGIIFLAVEIRQNTDSLDESRRLASANAYQVRASTFASHVLANAHSPGMVRAMVAFRAAGGEDDPADALATLPPEDQQRVRWFYLARIAIYDSNFYLYRNGYLDEDRYQSIDAPIIKGESTVWEALGYVMETQAFQEEIDRLRDQ